MSSKDAEKVVRLREADHLPTALRNIADELEAGVHGAVDQATIIFPGASEVFHLGGFESTAWASALLNMTCGTHKMAAHVAAATSEE